MIDRPHTLAVFTPAHIQGKRRRIMVSRRNPLPIFCIRRTREIRFYIHGRHSGNNPVTNRRSAAWVCHSAPLVTHSNRSFMIRQSSQYQVCRSPRILVAGWPHGITVPSGSLRMRNINVISCLTHNVPSPYAGASQPAKPHVLGVIAFSLFLCKIAPPVI